MTHSIDLKSFVRSIFTGALLCVILSSTYGQNLDSIQSVIAKLPDGEQKVDALHELIINKLRKLNATSRSEMQEARQMAIDLDYKFGLGRNDELQGMIYIQIGELDSAQIYLLRALTVYEKLDVKPRLAFAYDRLAQVQIVRNNFDQGQEYIDQAVKYAENLDDRMVLATINNNQAALFIRKAWALDRKSQLEERSALFKQSIPFLRAAIPHFQALGNQRGVGTCYVNLGIVQMELGNYAPTLGFMRQAIAKFETQKSDASLAIVYGYMGDAYIHIGNNDSAMYWTQSALAIAGELDQNLEVLSGFRRLRQIYEESNNYKKALFYQDKYDSLNAILLNEQKQATIDELQIRYETEKSEKELIAKQQVIDEQRMLMYFIVLICVVFIILAYVIYLKRVKIERLNEELEEKTDKLEQTSFKVTKKNAELNDAMQQQSNLMSVVVHDLRSPLNNVIGLLQLMDLAGELNKEQQEAYDKILQVSNDGLSLIEDISSLNRLRLKNKPKIKPLNFDKMIADLVSMHRASAEAKRIELILTTPDDMPEEIKTDRLMVARILDNLISNAIKFSPFDREVVVDYSFIDGVLEIHVIDQGQGLSEEDQRRAFQRFTKLSARPTAGESSNGLGLFIVKNLVERLKGSVRIDSKQGKGATFVITLPIER